MDEKTYEERLEEVLRANREWRRARKRKGSIDQVESALRSYTYRYGQRTSTVEKAAPDFEVTLPRVSIIETPHDLTDADYIHGVRALREAGL